MLSIGRMKMCVVALLLLAGAASQVGASTIAQSVDRLIIQMKTGDAEAQSDASDALAKIGAPAIKPLLDLIDSDGGPAIVVTIQGNIGASAVKPILDSIGSDEGSVMWAVVTLGKIGSPAIGPLKVAIQDRNENTRTNAAFALGQNPDPRSVDILISAFRDHSPRVAACAALSLRDKGSRAVQPVLALLNDESPTIRRLAATALSQLKDKCAVPALIERLNDDSREVRAASAQALGYIGDHRAVDPLMAVLSDRNEQSVVRSRTVYALGKIGDVRALDLLISTLGDTTGDTYVRSSAASALGEFKNERVVEPLISMLADKDEDLRQTAALSLGFLGSIATKRLTVLLNDGSAVVRSSAADALLVSHDKAAVGPLIAALKDTDATVRKSVARALCYIDGKRARAALNASFDARDLAVVAGAASFFIEQGKPGSEQMLIDALDAYGDEFMANEFFSSDNTKLKEAAEAWAAKHDVELSDLPGVSKWGCAN